MFLHGGDYNRKKRRRAVVTHFTIATVLDPNLIPFCDTFVCNAKLRYMCPGVAIH